MPAACLTKDHGGLVKMNPYASVKVGNETKNGQVHKFGAQNPKWQNNLLTFDLTNQISEIEISVFHKQLIFKKEVLVGKTRYSIANLFQIAGQGPTQKQTIQLLMNQYAFVGTIDCIFEIIEINSGNNSTYPQQKQQQQQFNNNSTSQQNNNNNNNNNNNYQIQQQQQQKYLQEQQFSKYPPMDSQYENKEPVKQDFAPRNNNNNQINNNNNYSKANQQQQQYQSYNQSSINPYSQEKYQQSQNSNMTDEQIQEMNSKIQENQTKF